MKDFEATMDGLAAVALGVYLAVVILRGNGKAFLAEIQNEAGFVEFIIALWVLAQLAKIPEVKPVVMPMALAAGVILALRIASGANMSVFSDFAAGRTGLYGLVTGVFGTQN